MLQEGRLDEAGRTLFENNPLTTVCSLVCNHENQCEGHCVLGRKGAPVHFSTIENYISTTYANKMTEVLNLPMVNVSLLLAQVQPESLSLLYLHDMDIR